jgi:cell division septation protein DedD
MRTFVVGSVIGAAAAVVAAPRLRRGRRPDGGEQTAGLEAFEGAPCWYYDRAQPHDAETR